MRTTKELRGMTKKEIKEEIENGEFQFNDEMEDIHMAIEGRLLELAPQAAAKLLTARSRDDQVALDMRLYLKDVIITTVDLIGELQLALVEQAEANKKIIMPGFTHLQAAQPILLAHHLLAYFEMLKRDAARFCDCFIRTDVLPLGSGALAGTTYATDRRWLDKELYVKEGSKNSRDAVSDRDCGLDYLSASSLMMMHLSRLAEELVLWASPCFDFIEIDDAYATASSIMPQKKNPYPLAYIRGVTASLLGHLASFASYGRIITGNPDSRIFVYGELPRSLDQGTGALKLMEAIFKGLKFNADIMLERVHNDYSYSSDLAEYMVQNHELDYRTAHQIVGLVVRKMIERKIPGDKLSAELLNQAGSEVANIKPGFTQDQLEQLIDPKNIIHNRKTIGGASTARVNEMFHECENIIDELSTWHELAWNAVQFSTLEKALRTL